MEGNKMKSKIISLGNNKDYRIVQTDYESLKKAILTFNETTLQKSIYSNIFLEKDLSDMLETDETISFDKFSFYANGIELTIGPEKKLTLPQVLELYFKKVEKYCNDHKADFALIQNLYIKGHRTHKIFGLVTLLNSNNS